MEWLRFIIIFSFFLKRWTTLIEKLWFNPSNNKLQVNLRTSTITDNLKEKFHKQIEIILRVRSKNFRLSFFFLSFFFSFESSTDFTDWSRISIDVFQSSYLDRWKSYYAARCISKNGGYNTPSIWEYPFWWTIYRPGQGGNYVLKIIGNRLKGPCPFWMLSCLISSPGV